MSGARAGYVHPLQIATQRVSSDKTKVSRLIERKPGQARHLPTS